MNKKIIISTSELREMLARAGYLIPKNETRTIMVCYHFKLYSNDEFEVSGTDGFRIAYQTKQFGNLEGDAWAISVKKERLDFALTQIQSEEVEVSCSPGVVSLLSLKEVRHEGLSTFVDGVENSWSMDSTYIVARGRKCLAIAPISAKDFFAQLKVQLSVPPLTIKGLDNDDAMFVYAVNFSSVTLSKGVEKVVEGAHMACVNKKFISDIANHIDKKGSLTVKICATNKPDSNMVIIEDKNGGHAIMFLKPVKPHFLRNVKSGEYFRVSGYPLTFHKKGDLSILQDSEKGPESLDQYRSHRNTPVYSLPDSMEVFLETYEEQKLREKRWRKNAKKKQ